MDDGLSGTPRPRKRIHGIRRTKNADGSWVRKGSARQKYELFSADDPHINLAKLTPVKVCSPGIAEDELTVKTEAADQKERP